MSSRCANAYLVSRAGLRKLLLQLPVWCSIDWMMNAARYATLDPGLQTQVYVMEPPLFVEGSKTGVQATTIEPAAMARRGDTASSSSPTYTN